MKKFIRCFLITIVLFSLELTGEPKKVITENEVEKYKKRNTFILKYSNLIYVENEKKIVIPIFQGTKGDVLYNTFRDYCLKEKYLSPKVRESGFAIKSKNGELRKTFHEFFNFYKSNIFKDIDINKPTKMLCDGYQWFIVFDFDIDGVPCYFWVKISSSEEDNKNYQKYKSPYEIKTDEKKDDPHFIFTIFVGSKSTDK